MGNWEVEFTDQYEDWFDSLPEEHQVAVDAVVEVLEDQGPVAPRPVVGLIQSSQHKNMKELIISAGGRDLRVLFMFDPRRTAILLLGGDKTGEWVQWYVREVPRADELYDDYLQELKREGLLP